MKGSAKIEFTNAQSNCFSFTSWPLSVNSTPGNVKVLAIQTDSGEKHFLSVISSAPKHSSRGTDNVVNVIKINGKYGNALKIRDGETVLYWEVHNAATPANVNTAKVSCCSEDDWEILETNAEYVSGHLLNQLRVVYSGQKFPFWLSKTMTLHLKIDTISPALEYGILSSNTEIVIPSLTSPTTYTLPKKLRQHQKLRIHPLILSPQFSLSPSEVLLFTNKLHGFTYKCHVEAEIPESQEYIIVNLLGYNEDYTTQSRESCLSKVKLYFVDSIQGDVVKCLCPLVNIPCIYLHTLFLQSTNLETKSWSWVHAVPDNALSSMTDIDNAGFRETSTLPSKETEFCGRSQIFNDCSTFIKASLLLTEQHFGDNLPCPKFGSLLIYGAPGSGKSCLAHAIITSLSLSPYFVHQEYVSCAKLRGKKPESVEKELLKRIRVLVEKQPSIFILDDIDVLIPAPKTEPSQQEEFLHYKISETLLEIFMKLRNERISVICTALSTESLNDYWKSRTGFHFFQQYIKVPSLSKAERLEVFITYLKRYLNKSGSGGLRCFTKQTTAEASTKSSYNQIVHGRDNKKETVPSVSRAGALQDKGITDAVHDLFHILGGDDELRKQIELALGSTHEKNATPQFLVNVAKKWGAYLQSHLDYESTVQVAEGGHVPSSVGREAACGINNIKTNEDVNGRMRAFNEILEEEIRFSVDLNEMSKRKWQSNLNKVSWESIGGLAGVKQELKKILEWPIKFPQFFKNAPIKLPCGILFYGYPGTGKSLMGLAIQTIVNVKFIHVKGPELLSKYIGASEQAVQDVFSRARESQPCILFFDEFDSLVPRRGHDSSGVTDRVVNQFLSEMDGVDGGLGEGVYLIASTSRPDLIDPAVLRPGRLDRHLFFDLPSKQERKDILRVICSQVGLNLENESAWNEICTLTEGFTGADLNALMFTAQLSVVHEYLSKLNNDCDDGAKLELLDGRSTSSNSTAAVPIACSQESQVTRENLLSALKDFKPSLQGHEFRKFQAIYHEFAVSKTGGKNDGAKQLFQVAGTKQEEDMDKNWKMQPGKRATLA